MFRAAGRDEPAHVISARESAARDQPLSLGCFKELRPLLGSSVTAMSLAKGGRGGRQNMTRKGQQKAKD